MFEAAIVFDETLEGGKSPWRSKRDDFHQMVERYLDNLNMAADAIKPPTDINSAELTEIAEQVVIDPDAKLPKPIRGIVNAGISTHLKDHYTIDFSERTIAKSPDRWKEFQIATVESEQDQHYLWYIT